MGQDKKIEAVVLRDFEGKFFKYAEFGSIEEIFLSLGENSNFKETCPLTIFEDIDFLISVSKELKTFGRKMFTSKNLLLIVVISRVSFPTFEATKEAPKPVIEFII